MKRFSILCASIALTCAAMNAQAAVIDFETQAATRGGIFTGAADSPLTIGIATFTGGELLKGEVGLPADQTGVYATQLFSVNETNPLVINFSVPISNFRVFVANGGEAQNYTVSDNLGESVVKSLSTAGSGGAATFSLTGSGLKTVQILGASGGWNFAIDNVSFAVAAATPEPGSLLLLASGLALLAAWRRRKSASL